jgi:PPK2 family polyphosphate:nucleotide phosphotransferase
MFEAIQSPNLVPFDGTFKRDKISTQPPGGDSDKKKNKKRLKKKIDELDELQRILYADDRYSILLIFQALDAGGKDSTIRAVMTGVNPAGCQVFSFKQPTPEELDHDFLWRTTRRLPERGRIGIFNRSYYEEVLVVRVHPQYLKYQKLPYQPKLDTLWQQRFKSIRDFEENISRNGTVILKFWLNISKEEQKRRFLARIENPEKNFKFAASDVEERKYWDQYMLAFEEALNATSRPWAPWYAIPADDKPYMRYCVADIIVENLKTLDLKYPTINRKEKDKIQQMYQQLKDEK